MDENFTFLGNHVFRDDIQISKRLVHKCGNIIGSLKDFCIDVAINEIKKLIKNLLNITNFIKISNDQRVLRQEFLFLLFKSLFKFVFDFLFLIFKFLLQIKEAFVNIFHLLEFQSFEFFLDLL